MKIKKDKEKIIEILEDNIPKIKRAFIKKSKFAEADQFFSQLYFEDGPQHLIYELILSFT